jgi:hypothetical protein
MSKKDSNTEKPAIAVDTVLCGVYLDVAYLDDDELQKILYKIEKESNVTWRGGGDKPTNFKLDECRGNLYLKDNRLVYGAVDGCRLVKRLSTFIKHCKNAT